MRQHGSKAFGVADDTDALSAFRASIGMHGAFAKGDGPQLSAAIPEDTTSTEVLAIGGSRTGSIDFVGDGDFYQVTLVAGQSYAFTMTGQGLPDTYLELYDSNGNLLALDDDAGPGTDSLLRYTATSSGTYFLNARAYEDTGVSNTGGYQVNAALGPAQNPLDAINLGLTVSQQNITVYFAASGESNPFGDTATRNWTQTEINAVFAAFATFEAITNLTFTQVGSSAGARFVLELADLDPGTLGYFGTSGGVGYGAFDPLGTGWSNGLFAGGLGFTTLIHEIGHGLGLAHPHDNGGTSEVMQGVLAEFGSYGTFGLNQGVFTMMSYNDGSPLQPGGAPRSSTFGNEATPMALDIALLQQKYGADPNTNSGNSTYTLPDSNSTGTGFIGIWDTGGTDLITYAGARNATIDLRTATLLNAPGGGGFISFATGVGGGFTIAAGVTIENATGGSGADTITGNDAANILTGNGGADSISGGLGNDTLIGGDGDDILDDMFGLNSYDGGNGNDFAAMSLASRSGVLSYTVGNGAVTENGSALITTTSIERISIVGGSANDSFTGGSLDDTLDGGAGNDTLTGGFGNDTYGIDSTSDVIVELSGQGNDTARTTLLTFNLGATAGSANVENLTYAGSGNFVGVGGAFAGTLTGGPGNDTLIGSQAGGSLDGGDGNDVLWFYGSTTLQGGAGFDHAIQLDQSSQFRSIGADSIEVYIGNIGDDSISAIGASGSVILYGGAGGDTLQLGIGGGYMFGQDGNDTLTGGGGNDNLLGNAGADTLNAGAGNDVMYIDAADGQNFDGGDGIDYAIVEGGGGTVNVNLSTRNVEVFIGNTGSDTIDASGVTYAMGLYGFDGNDTINGPSASSQLFGQNGNDILNAGAVNDIVLGGAGADQLFGNAGDDLLIGEAGDDTIVGGTGADILWGDVNGTGNDSFRFAAADVQAGVRDQINDFGDATGNQDVIQFSGITQNQVTIANDGAGNVLLTIAASGGNYSILVIGMTAAAIQDDLVFGP